MREVNLEITVVFWHIDDNAGRDECPGEVEDTAGGNKAE